MASPKSTLKPIDNPKSRQSDSDDPLPSSTASPPASPKSHNTRRSVSFADDVALDHTTDSLTAIPPCPPSPSPADSPFSDDLKQPWYTRLLSSYRSVSLENKGSVARDHLALERTFLAWLRTSLAFSSIGIAITQLFRLNTSLAEEQGKTAEVSLLPLSPLMGASLTPEAYALALQTTLDQHLARSSRLQLQLQNYAHSAHATLLDQLVRTQSFDGDAARRLRRLGKPLGATFLGISVVILLIGFRRYFESQHWIIRGQFPASRGSVAITGAIAAALIIASLVIVLVVVPGAYNK